MEAIDEGKLAKFCQRFREFLSDVEARKKRGQNNFNPLLCVQKQDDEANMHSGFLYGLLNPKGEHYQDDLFLKLFLDSVKFADSVRLKEWFGYTSGAEVHKEWAGSEKNGRADLYITNHHKHIIVENKIWAKDQERQIERYIEKLIKSESSVETAQDSELESSSVSDMDSNADSALDSELDSSVACEDIALIYLTPHGKEPDKSSLGKWHIEGEYLIDNKGNKVRYLQISYEKHILEWLESCLREIGGISSLRSAIECYADVVKRVTGQKEDMMGIDKFLTRSDKLEENMEIAFEILRNRKQILETYYNMILEKHRGDIEKNNLEIIMANPRDKREEWDSQWVSGVWYPRMIKPKDCGARYFAFGIECYKNQYMSYALGVRLFGKTQKWGEYSRDIRRLGIKPLPDSWWLDGYNTDRLEMLEHELQKFLDSIDTIKSLNEKLKSYREE